MFLPFSPRAKEWEPAALALRRLAEVGPDDSLDPWVLAPKVGLTVAPVDIQLLPELSDENRVHLFEHGSPRWSGGVFPIPLPDGTYLCLLNPSHSFRRNKITLMEEISHIYLGHQPSQLILCSDRLKVRDYDPRQEAEAYGVGAAALLPWQSFFRWLHSGRTAEDLAEQYDVSSFLVEYRIKVTGATRLYQARQRAKAGVS